MIPTKKGKLLLLDYSVGLGRVSEYGTTRFEPPVISNCQHLSYSQTPHPFQPERPLTIFALFPQPPPQNWNGSSASGAVGLSAPHLAVKV